MKSIAKKLTIARACRHCGKQPAISKVKGTGIIEIKCSACKQPATLGRDIVTATQKWNRKN